MKQIKDIVPGLKRDEEKVKLSLVHPDMIEGLAKVFMYGLGKYHFESWKSFSRQQATTVLVDPAMRHFELWRKGEKYDRESGLHHLLHAAWNILVIWWHDKGGKAEESKRTEV